MTVGRLRNLIAETLVDSETPALDALILLETATSRDRADLLAEFRSPVREILTESTLEALSSLIERRSTGDSIAYITGVKEFYGYEFSVGPGALVPRPESEHLVESGLRLLDQYRDARIHDCFTGSGCVGISLALERAAHGYTTDLVLSDIQPAALDWAARNAERLLNPIREVRYSVEQRDVLMPVSTSTPLHRPIHDLITANPPYLTDEEMEEVTRRRHTEPASALAGGKDGLGLYQKVASQAYSRLLPERYVLVEHGWTQGAQVRDLFRRAGFDRVETITDLAGRERLVQAQRPTDNS
jgi:release factor glutamine methyltransferase